MFQAGFAMRIDIHTHAFPDRLAQRAKAGMEKVLGFPCQGTGCLADLSEDERKAGIDVHVVLCCAATAGSTANVNAYALQCLKQGVPAFGSVHPECPSWEQELDRLENGGIRGLKLHPEYQGIAIDDARFEPLFEALQGRFCVVVHTGGTTGSLKLSKSSPARLLNVLRKFPRMDVVAAHFGGQGMWQEALDILKSYRGEHLWLDTSSSTKFVSKDMLSALFSLRPSEYYLFGSDWPIFTPSGETDRLMATGLRDEAIEKLMGNARLLLGQYGMLPV